MQNDGASTSPLDREHAEDLGGGPVLDSDAFGALEELAGDDDPDLIADLVGLYLEDSATRMGEVEAGRQASELDRIGSAAHALKSASANIGALSFSKLCATIEKTARSDEEVDPAALDELCRRALAMYEEVRETLASFDTPA